MRYPEASQAYFGLFMTELTAAKLVGDGGIFNWGYHVPVTHMGYFMLPQMLSSPSLGQGIDLRQKNAGM